MTDLLAQKCAHAAAPLDEASVTALLPQVAGWAVHGGWLCRDFAFADYDETLAFVNALAWMVRQEDHHPELTVTYRNCIARYQTHTAAGITLNDFICAAKANALYAQRCGA
jgi:4a-hydroxytetrahydrobiopterin dehydratase